MNNKKGPKKGLRASLELLSSYDQVRIFQLAKRISLSLETQNILANISSVDTNPREHPKNTIHTHCTKKKLETLIIENEINGLATVIQNHLKPIEENYFELDFYIREKILNHLSAEIRAKFSFLLNLKDKNILPIERFTIYLILLNQNRKKEAIEYYLLHQKEFTDLFTRKRIIGTQPTDEVCFKLGKMLVEESLYNEATIPLKLIPVNSKLYPDALLKISKISNKKVSYNLLKTLNRASSSQKKLDLIQFWTRKAISEGSSAIWIRAQLFSLWNQIYDLFPKDPKIYRKISQLIVKNTLHHSILPYLYNSLISKSVEFFSPTLEAAIWEPFSELNPHLFNHPFRLEVIRELANFHLFLLDSPYQEKKIWNAKNTLDNAEAQSITGMSWSKLVANLLNGLENPPLKYLHQKEYLKSFFTLTLDLPMTENTLKTYIALSDGPNNHSLTKILSAVREANQPELEIKTFYGLIQNRALTNTELQRLYFVSSQSGIFDLSWRVATVMYFRSVLSKSLKSAWEYSGEKRTTFPLIQLSVNHFKNSLIGSPIEKRIMANLIDCGPILMDLFKASKLAENVPRDPVYLNEIPYDLMITERFKDLFAHTFKTASKYNQINSEQISKDHLPKELKQLPRNFWVHFFIRTSQYFGISLFNWDLKKLIPYKDTIFLGVNFSEEEKFSNEVYSKLPLKTKNSLSQLLEDISQISGRAAKEIPLKLAFFYATASYQNHGLALKSVEKMTDSIYYIKEIEKYILSKPYSDLRRFLKTTSHIPTPKSSWNNKTLPDFHQQ